MADGLFFSKPCSNLFNTLTTCPFLELDSTLNKIDLITHHNELLNYISYFHQNNRFYRAVIIAEKLLSSGFSVPEKDYEFIFAAQRAGHILGLNKPITIKINQQKNSFTTEGGVNCQSLTFLIEKINTYLNYITNKKNSEKEHSAFELIAETLNNTIQKIYPHTHLYKQDSAKLLYQEYLNNQLIILTSGWKGHTVGLAIFNGLLIVCNRGPGTISGKGTNIYPILNFEAMSEKWFKDIIDLNNKTNILDFNKILSKVINVNSCKISFPSKPQKHGNCSYANVKSLLEGVIYLLLNSREKIILDISNNIEIQNREKYKNFTVFCRKHELFLILNKIHSTNSSKLLFYKQLLKNYSAQKKCFRKNHFQAVVNLLEKEIVISELIKQKKQNDNTGLDNLPPLNKIHLL